MSSNKKTVQYIELEISVLKNYNNCDSLNNSISKCGSAQYWAGGIQNDRAAQTASPLRTIGNSRIEIAAEVSSATGPCEVSGDKLAGADIGSLPVEGNIPGDSDGVAELEGMLEDFAGTSATAGEYAGVVTGVATGEGVAIDGVSAGEMVVAGEVAIGDWTGEVDGLDLGVEDEDTGDFAGVEAGEETGTWDFAGGDLEGEDIGAWEGAFVIWAPPEFNTKNRRTAVENNLDIVRNKMRKNRISEYSDGPEISRKLIDKSWSFGW